MKLIIKYIYIITIVSSFNFYTASKGSITQARQTIAKHTIQPLTQALHEFTRHPFIRPITTFYTDPKYTPVHTALYTLKSSLYTHKYYKPSLNWMYENYWKPLFDHYYTKPMMEFYRRRIYSSHQKHNHIDWTTQHHDF